MESTMTDDVKPHPLVRRWGKIMGGLLMAVVAFVLNLDITEVESTGGTLKLPSVLIALYSVGGKWFVVGPFAALGTWLMYRGVREFRS
jgi:uncharacterized integral membrane protein